MIKYRGGKAREIKKFIHHLKSQKYDSYYEPFIGGGAVYFDLEPQNAIINDINTKLIDFYVDVKNNFSRIKNELEFLENVYNKNQQQYDELKMINSEERVLSMNEKLYYELREEFNYPTGKYLRGTVYYFINKTSYSGMIRYNKKGEYNVPFGRYKGFNAKGIDIKHYELLKNAQILNLDYEEVFKKASSKDIMFLDPPYDCVFNDYGNIQLGGGFDEDQHRRLAENFKNLNTRSLMIIGKTKLTEELYRNYIVDEYSKKYCVNIKNRFRNSAIHIVVSNYL
ncbi:DNA methyltransferase [Clostridium acetobutylicum]|nr:DNA methyltransferase [Clostridium acetobutylicum]